MITQRMVDIFWAAYGPIALGVFAWAWWQIRKD